MEMISYHWTWAVAAVILIVLELFAPGIAFLWLGIAAGIVAVIVFFLPMISGPWQLILYAVLAVVSVLLGRRYLKRHPLKTSDVLLNRRGEQYVGRRFTLTAPIVNGRGKLKVDDTNWVVEGPDLPAGTGVKVVRVDNVILVVERAED